MFCALNLYLIIIFPDQFIGDPVKRRGVPKFYKHIGVASDCIACDFKSDILPMSKRVLLIDILICQIDAAAERHHAIHHHNFTVISVI